MLLEGMLLLDKNRIIKYPLINSLQQYYLLKDNMLCLWSHVYKKLYTVKISTYLDKNTIYNQC